MTARGGSAASEGARRPAAWLVAVVLAVGVLAVVFSVPYLVHWVWPGVDAGLLAGGNLILGGLLGSGAVVGFLYWKWEL